LYSEVFLLKVLRINVEEYNSYRLFEALFKTAAMCSSDAI